MGKIQARVTVWNNNFLSIGGKLILIKHVLNSIPIFLLQVLQPRQTIVKQLDRLLNKFLWDNWGDARMHWKSWGNLCFPVQDEVLGFRSFNDIVDAFSMKLWWKLRCNDSIWALFMSRKYIRHAHPMDSFSRVGSPTWGRLLQIRHKAEEHIFWQFGQGMVDFWRDKWVTNEFCIWYVGRITLPFRWWANFSYMILGTGTN